MDSACGCAAGVGLCHVGANRQQRGAVWDQQGGDGGGGGRGRVRRHLLRRGLVLRAARNLHLPSGLFHMTATVCHRMSHARA